MSDHGNAIPQVILDDPFWNRFRETVVRMSFGIG